MPVPRGTRFLTGWGSRPTLSLFSPRASSPLSYNSQPCLSLPFKSATPELTKLGERLITSFEDGSKASELCRQRYPALRDNLLRDHVWAFAKAHVALDALTGSPSLYRWTHKFQLPGNCGRIISITREGDPVPFERFGNIFYADTGHVDLRYIQNFPATDDATAFPDDFAEALANLLASDLAMSLVQSIQLRDLHLNFYGERISQARFNGAVERHTIAEVASSWIEAHQGWAMDTIDPRLRGLAGT